MCGEAIGTMKALSVTKPRKVYLRLTGRPNLLKGRISLYMTRRIDLEVREDRSPGALGYFLVRNIYVF